MLLRCWLWSDPASHIAGVSTHLETRCGTKPHCRRCDGNPSFRVLKPLNPKPYGCRRALTADREQAEATALERRLGWYAAGQHIALDVARGLHFLHKSGVRTLNTAAAIAELQCRSAC